MAKDSTGYGGKSPNAKLGGPKQALTPESIRREPRFVTATMGNARPTTPMPKAAWSNEKA